MCSILPSLIILAVLGFFIFLIILGIKTQNVEYGDQANRIKLLTDELKCRNDLITRLEHTAREKENK